jgi:DNA-binding NarL/FixJ family response regulator
MQRHFTTYGKAAMPGYNNALSPDRLTRVSDKYTGSAWTISSNARHQGASTPFAFPGESKAQMKILVIDHHPLLREGLRHVLTQLCTQLLLVEAAAGAEALDQVSANPDINLALLDLELPDMDGFRTLAALRKECPAMPVVVLAERCDRQIVLEAIDMGAMGFISKSTSSQVILGALRLVLSGGVYLPKEVLVEAGFRSGPGQRKSSNPVHDEVLTKRQREVLALIAQGKSNKVICRELGLAEGTVKIHVSAILRALMVCTRTQAVVAAGHGNLGAAPTSPREWEKEPEMCGFPPCAVSAVFG